MPKWICNGCDELSEGMGIWLCDDCAKKREDLMATISVSSGNALRFTTGEGSERVVSTVYGTPDAIFKLSERFDRLEYLEGQWKAAKKVFEGIKSDGD